MISRIRGKVVEHEGPISVVDCGGVGYGVHVLSDEQALLKLDEITDLYIYEHIKEEAHDLYGFLTKSRKELFEKLLGVNGVGPKAAVAITNLGAEGQVRSAIAKGDVKYISSASGVGKKVAERVIVDLKNKVGLTSSDEAVNFLYETAVSDQDEAMQALVALGYAPQDAVNLLAKIDNTLPLEERVRMALKR